MLQHDSPRLLVGRASVLAEVLASVSRPGGHGALIVADAGMGKSALAGLVAADLESSVNVHRIHASASLSTVPYGALAPLIPDLAAADTDSPLAVMRALLRRLFPTAEEGEDPSSAPLVVVDDAHALDAASADLLAQLVASAKIRILVLTRSLTDIPAGIPNQVWDGMLSRHALPPLTEEQVHELSCQMLGGPVLRSTSAELARISGGNPMFVVALLTETVRAGTLVNRHGVWLLQERLLPPEGRLGDLLKAQLSGLTPAEREALEIIALAEPVPAVLAFDLGLHRAVDALTEAKLVSLSDDADRLLRPMHPLYGEVVRGMVPAARSARLRQRVLQVRPAGTERPENLLRWVSWSLDCGAQVPDNQLLSAAYMANNNFDSATALRSAQAVRDPERAVSARVQAARAHYQSGNLEAAAQLLHGTTEAATDLTTVKMSVLLQVQLLLRTSGTAAELSDAAEAWQAAVARIEQSAAGAAQNPALTADILSSRRGARLLALIGQVTDGVLGPAETELPRILQEGRRADDNEAVMVANAVLGEILVARGQARKALVFTRDAMDIMDGTGHRFLSYYQFVLYRHLSALLWLGEWEEVRKAVQRSIGATQGALSSVGGVVDFALGVIHLRANRPDAALTSFSTAIEGLRTYDAEGLLPMAMGLAAVTAVAEGRPALAESLLAEADSLERRGQLGQWLMASGYRAAARAAGSPDPDRNRQLLELARQAEGLGLAAAEFEVRSLSVDLGDFSALGRILKITEEFEGPQAGVMNLFARAVLDQDANELIRLATEPQGPEGERLAQQAMREALRVAKASGDRTLHNRVQRVVSKQSGTAPVQRLRPGIPVLTRRERDVAALVVRGLRNSEIAEQLFLSVRTVEGHIYRTFEKLGISRREDLKAELQPGED